MTRWSPWRRRALGRAAPGGGQSTAVAAAGAQPWGEGVSDACDGHHAISSDIHGPYICGCVCYPRRCSSLSLRLPPRISYSILSICTQTYLPLPLYFLVGRSAVERWREESAACYGFVPNLYCFCGL